VFLTMKTVICVICGICGKLSYFEGAAFYGVCVAVEQPWPVCTAWTINCTVKQTVCTAPLSSELCVC